MTSDVFTRIVGSLDYPMFVVTTSDGGERSGCLAGFLTQCSIEPRRLLVCVSKTNHTYRVVQRAAALAVHPLRADQHDIAVLFGEETGDEIDKFARCAWRDGPDGVPVLEGCDWIVGRIVERHDVGDHVAHLVAVTAAGDDHEDRATGQLGFQAVKTMDPGHAA